MVVPANYTITILQWTPAFKGPIDRVGRKINNTVFQKVKCNLIVINSALEFATHAAEFTSVTSLVLSASDAQPQPENVGEASAINDILKIDRVISGYNRTGAYYL